MKSACVLPKQTCGRTGVAVALVLGLLVACVERRRATPAARKPEQAPSAAPLARASAATAAAPSAPAVRLFASRFVVQVRKASSKDAPRIGYLRGGAVLPAKSATPIGYDKCRKGWYELATGGFVCSTLDAIAFAGPRLPERQALQPDLTVPLPYPYGYSRRRNTPVYRRLPTDEEAALHEGQRNPAVALDGGPEAQAPTATPIEPAAAELELAGVPGEGDERAEVSVPTLASLQGESGSVLMRRMERGFYVSLDREMEKGRRRYWRTQSNGFIPSRGLLLVGQREFQGLVLRDRGLALPLGFVLSNKSSAYTANERGQLRRAEQPGYHHAFPIVEQRDVRGVAHYVAADGRLYRAQDVARIERRAQPAEVAADEKWVDVDLTAQSLVAYVGAEPLFATLISSGRIKDDLDPLKNFETPRGAFRISSKHLTASMDGDHAIDGPYSIEDVPYVMYFELAFALHSAFWHNSFGRPRSHGCINLAPLDAKWLFEFVEPGLPRGWHGVYATKDRVGSMVVVHE